MAHRAVYRRNQLARTETAAKTIAPQIETFRPPAKATRAQIETAVDASKPHDRTAASAVFVDAKFIVDESVVAGGLALA
jgi:hypothetical protein